LWTGLPVLWKAGLWPVCPAFASKPKETPPGWWFQRVRRPRFLQPLWCFQTKRWRLPVLRFLPVR
jgi:hypothetical protein